MRIIFKIFAVLFAIASFGLLIQGKINPMILILAALFGYLGWRTKSKDADSSGSSEINKAATQNSPIDYPDDYLVTESYHFYDTYFRDQMELWRSNHGTEKYEKIKERVLTSDKVKMRIRKCAKEGGTYLGPKDVAALINGIKAFTFSKVSDQVLAAKIFVHAWHHNVNRKFETFNPHQVTKYLNDVSEVIGLSE